MSNSEFAKRQLKKHGWKEGSGLGKEEHGRSEPIKVSLKMDKTGVGHDPGKEFTDQWWLRVFNEAAQKIGKKDKSASKSLESVEEKAKSKKEEQRKNFYKGFVQSSTLTNGVEEKNISSGSSSEDEEEASNSVSIPTLDDIHKFCGGATGHRAASFGIRMEGKIKRASHHEKQFEEQAKSNGSNSTTSGDVLGDSGFLDSTKKLKKKKKREKNESSEKSNDNLKRKSVDKLESDVEIPSSKKHKQKRKSKVEKDICELDIGREHLENTADCGSKDVPQEKKKKKKKHISSEGDDVDEICDSGISKKKKKKKKSD